MKKRQIKTIEDYRELIQFLAVNAHNLLIDAYIPGQQAQIASKFMEKCKEIARQLENESKK